MLQACPFGADFTRIPRVPRYLGTRSGDDARSATGPSPLRPGIQSGSPHTPFYHPAGPARTRTHASTPRAQRLAPVTRAVLPDPLSLATTHGTSFPAPVLRCFTSCVPRANARCRPTTAGGSPFKSSDQSPCWRLPEAYRSLKRPSSVLSAKASHHTPFCKQPARPIRERRENRKPTAKTPLATQIIIPQMITHKTIKHQTPKSPAKSTAEDTPKGRPARVHYPVLKPPRTAREPTHPTRTGDRHGARNTSHAKRRGVAVREPQKHARTTPGRTARPARPKADSTLPHPIPAHPAHPGQQHRPPDSGLKSP